MLTDILLLLCLAVVNIALFRRLKLPAILAYLFTGLILGPFGLALIGEYHKIEIVAELGVVFLMFSLGLEFSLPKLMAMRRLVLGLGGAQVVITFTVFYLICINADISWQQGVAVAGALTMSSTAIIIKQLAEQQKVHTRRGQLAISVLLFQDVAVVPFLIVVPILALQSGDSGELWLALAASLGKGCLAVILILSIGKWLLPPIFHEVSCARSDELFVLTTLLVALLAGGLTHLLGLSMALGAFLAGMMLGESHYRYQLEADIRPFRDILMGLFFITIGMLIDLSVLAEYWFELMGLVVCLMLAKGLIVTLLAISIKERGTDAIASGLMLSQVGEFGFVLLALAGKHQLISAQLSSIVVSAGVMSMAITPWLVKYSHSITVDLLHGSEHLFKKRNPLPDQYTGHVIICGYGRVGQTIARFLSSEGIPYVALDRDPVRVKESCIGGDKVEFGDAGRREILLTVGITKAKLVILTFDNRQKALSLLSLIAILNPDAKVLVRTKDDSGLNELRSRGAAEVVPESLEGSLMLVSHVLMMSGVPISRIFKRMKAERDAHYQHLHGFYHGDTSDHQPEEGYDLEQLHAVYLPESAMAVGKAINQLQLGEVQIRGLRRNGREIAHPAKSELLRSDDVLLLCGKKHEVELAEHWLLEGH